MNVARHAYPLLVNDAELAVLRGGPDPNACFRRLQSRCMDYVLSYRQYSQCLSVEDGEEIVSQAVVEELPSIADSRASAQEASLIFKRALNRVRARYARSAQRVASIEAAPAADRDMIVAIQFKEVARALRTFLGLALASLSDRDHDLLIDCYSLERFGVLKRGPSPLFASASARKVGLFRARRRFLAEVERVLEEASAMGRNSDLVGSVRELFKRGGMGTHRPQVGTHRLRKHLASPARAGRGTQGAPIKFM